MSNWVLFVSIITMMELCFIHGLKTLINPITSRSDYITTITSAERGYGTWNGMKYCLHGQWAKNIEFRSQLPQDPPEDNVAAVGVSLICQSPSNTTKYHYQYRTYDNGNDWGVWNGTNGTCTDNAWIIGFRTRVHYCPNPISECNDDTALNCVQLKCSDGTILEPTNCGSFGNGYQSSFSECPDGSYICGWNELFEEHDQWADNHDETALNAIKLACCNYTEPPTKSPTIKPTIIPTTISTEVYLSDVFATIETTDGMKETANIDGETNKDHKHMVNSLWIALGVSIVLICVLCCIVIICGYKWYKHKEEIRGMEDVGLDGIDAMSEEGKMIQKTNTNEFEEGIVATGCGCEEDGDEDEENEMIPINIQHEEVKVDVDSDSSDNDMYEESEKRTNK